MAVSPRSALDEPFATARALYDRGMCLAAWEAARARGPLASWEGTGPRVLAGRLAYRLGAPRLGALLHLRAYRADPLHPEAQYYYVLHTLQRRGPLSAWQERCRLGAPRTEVPEDVAEYHGQCGQILATLRDFAQATARLERAESTMPERPYGGVEWSQFYTLQDRYDEALHAAQRGLELGDGEYPPAVLATARSFVLLNRDQEALDLLRATGARGQHADTLALLVQLLVKHRLLDEAEQALVRFEALTPFKEDEANAWLARQRADITILRGDYRSALQQVEQVDSPFYREMGENLRAFLRDREGDHPRRVEHAVGFVRQHERTCAPATLSAISAFWNRPAEHLAVAEEICYDGTPNHSERRWAEENGWRTREFRVDWASATALLDRGVPFTLTIADVTMGHLQAVIGYDEALGVLLARDPWVPDTIEVLAEELLRQQRSLGPRGMAMVPLEESHLLDGVELPDADIYDRYHALQLALEAHDRERAVQCHEELVEASPEHRLTLAARGALARYDANPHEWLGAVDALLSLYPGDARLQLARLEGLRQLERRAERLSWLGEACEQDGADPMLRIEYAAELGADDRRIFEAAWHLRRAMRRRPLEPHAVHRLADLDWRRGHRESAVELYRFASCLDELNETYAREYFSACRWEKQTGTALAFLEARVERVGARSGDPAATLFGALEALDRTDDAFAVLARAVDRRPSDGAVRLFAASRCAQYGRLDEAREHLEAARGRVKHTAWLAQTARVARLEGDREQALDHWREIVRAQPLDVEGHGMVALLLSETSTRFEAVEHLHSVCERFPHHAGLCRLLYDWTAGDPAVERERVLRKLAGIDHADAWVRRELAINLHQQGRLDEALTAAREAVALEAGNTYGHSVAGHVLSSMGRRVDAVACFSEAIRRSADNAAAIHGLLNATGGSASERREVLEFVERRMLAQTVFGNGLLAFREAARGVLTPDEMLAALRRAHAGRLDLWHAWSALCRHLSDMGRSDEALELAREATERFSTIPRVWLDLSHVHQARLELDQEVEALERCRELNPDWIEATLQLSDAWERAGRQDESVELLEGCIKRMPLVPQLRARLASMLHRRGEVEGALATLREALRLNPDFPWAWQALAEWSQANGQTRLALDLARGFAQSRPGEPRPWIQVGELQLAAKHPEAALEASERALAINPRLSDACDLRARALVMLRRFADAKAACRPAAFAEGPPLWLKGRAAWVDAQLGDLTAAVRRMQAVLEAHPDYTWGWQRLVEWCAGQGELRTALQAAERLAWLEPGDVVPLGWVGELKERMHDRAGAKAAFERAMRLEPSYSFAGFRYLAIQRAEGDIEGTKRTLEILRLYASEEQILLAQVQDAVAQSDLKRSLTLLGDMCRQQAFDRAVLVEATGAIAEREWRSLAERWEWSRKLERMLRRRLATPPWHDVTPLLWAKVRISRGRLGGIRSYRWLAGLATPGRVAVVEFLGEIARRARSLGRDWTGLADLSWHLFWIRVWCRPWRAVDDVYWGQMGYALLCTGRFRDVIRWMRDWRTRKRASPSALQNLAVALLRQRRDREARALLRHAASALSASVEGTSRLRLWCAIAACLDGDVATAQRLLRETPETMVQTGDRWLRALALTVVAILRDPVGRVSLTRDRREAIAVARAQAGPGASERLLHLATYHVARHGRAPWMIARSWLRLYGRWVIGGALAVLVGVALLG